MQSLMTRPVLLEAALTAGTGSGGKLFGANCMGVGHGRASDRSYARPQRDLAPSHAGIAPTRWGVLALAWGEMRDIDSNDARWAAAGERLEVEDVEHIMLHGRMAAVRER